MARHDWKVDQRITLWLLNTRFSLTIEEIAQLLNRIYAE